MLEFIERDKPNLRKIQSGKAGDQIKITICVKQCIQSQNKSQTFLNGNLAGKGIFPMHPEV